MWPFHKTETSENREDLVRELTYIELHTLRAARNSLLGEYRSSLRGEGLDFIEHKIYVAGDDYRRIDWNVVARTRQPYVKICREEKEMKALIVADLSRSMDLGSERFSKKEVLIEAVATLAFSAAAANMAVGLVAGADRVELFHPPRKGRSKAWELLDSLLAYRPGSRRTDLKPLLSCAREQLKHPSMVFFLSDFIGVESLLGDALLSSTAVHHDLVPIIIEDRLERDIPAVRGFVRVHDLEGDEEQLLSLSADNCRVFAASMEERRQSIRKAFLRLGIIPVTLSTGQSPLHPLMSFFLERTKGRR